MASVLLRRNFSPMKQFSQVGRSAHFIESDPGLRLSMAQWSNRKQQESDFGYAIISARFRRRIQKYRADHDTMTRCCGAHHNEH